MVNSKIHFLFSWDFDSMCSRVVNFRKRPKTKDILPYPGYKDTMLFTGNHGYKHFKGAENKINGWGKHRHTHKMSPQDVENMTIYDAPVKGSGPRKRKYAPPEFDTGALHQSKDRVGLWDKGDYTSPVPKRQKKWTQSSFRQNLFKQIPTLVIKHYQVQIWFSLLVPVNSLWGTPTQNSKPTNENLNLKISWFPLEMSLWEDPHKIQNPQMKISK